MKRIAILIFAIGLSLFAQTAQATTWGAIQRLTWTSGASECPAVAVNASGHIHVVWQDKTPGNYEIYYKKSTDGGASWTANVKLTTNTGASKNPAIAVDNSGYLHVVWQDDTPGNAEIYYRKSTNGGATWSTAARLTSTAGASECPAAAVDSAGHIHVVWQDSTTGNAEIYYKRSTNGGANWTANVRFTTNAGASKNPAIAIDPSGYLHVVWQDDTPGNADIYYKRSTNGGASWSANSKLTSNSGASECPAIAVSSAGYLHVVWQDSTPGNAEIYYKKSVNSGGTWSASTRLTWTGGVSKNAAIGIDSSNYLHLLWQDFTPGNAEIYYKNSTNGGAAWGANQRLTYTAGNSMDPSVAADAAGHVYAAWDDATPGNTEIYARKGSTVSLTPIAVLPAYDNYVSYSSADPNVANTVFPSGDLPVGVDFFYSLVGWDFLFWASALYFNCDSQIAGRNISKATLRLYVYLLRGEFSITPQIRLSAFATAWNPNTLTYNIYENMYIYNDGQSVKDAPVSAVVPFDFDVTYIVQQWASGNWPNYGFLLDPLNYQNLGDTSLQATSFQSLEEYYNLNQRPQLIIEFQ
jgi:hypothetical protein